MFAKQHYTLLLVTGTGRSGHILPVLRQLHWLPMRQRFVFKVATLVCQSLSGHAPGYLVDDCQLVTDVRVRQLTVERLLSTGRPAVSETGPSQLLELEQFAARLATTGRRPVQAFTEDISIRTVRPRRSVNSFNCAV